MAIEQSPVTYCKHITLRLNLAPMGAQGIIFPRVESPTLLEEAISWTKYPPIGTRGFGFMAPQLGYQSLSMPEIIEHLNTQTMIIVQFETGLSIERCNELLSVPGIDVAMVGPTDLSISLEAVLKVYGSPKGASFNSPARARWVEVRKDHQALKGQWH